MAAVDIAEVQKTTVEVIKKHIKDGTVETLTARIVRKEVEELLDLESLTLDSPEYKSAVKTTIDETLQAAEDQTEEAHTDEDDKPQKKEPVKAKSKSSAVSKAADKMNAKPKTTPKRKNAAPASSEKGQKTKKQKRSASVVPSSDDEEHKVEASTSSKPKVTAKDNHVHDLDEDSEVERPKKKAKEADNATNEKKSKAKAKASSAVEVHHSESEMSSVIDDGPPKKRGKQKSADKSSAGKAKAGKKEPKQRKTKEPAKELSKDEETIKRLKSFVVACGVRKVWAKEFKDLEQPSDQIRRLKQILAELGMTGRMSLEQAKSIREKRELAKELEDVQSFEKAVVSGPAGRSKRSSGATSEGKKVASDEDEDSDGGDVDAPKARRASARMSIMAFLGDQSSDDD